MHRSRGFFLLSFNLSTRVPRSTGNTQRKREQGTFCATRGARAGHLGFVDGDPLKGGDERCREVEAGSTASRTMAATAGQSWRRRWQSFPLLQRPLVDRLRVSVGEGVGGAVNLVPSAPAPHPYLLWHCATGAHQPEEGWAPPIRARGEDRVELCRWAESGPRSILIS